MGHIFWFTGRIGSGKTTITTKIKKLNNDFTIKVIDGDKIVNNLGGVDFRKKNMDVFIKKAITLVEISSKKNDLVLVAIMCPKQKQRNYARRVLGLKYHEIFLQCSERSCAERVTKRKIRIYATIRRQIRKLYTDLTSPDFNPNSYEVPTSPDLVIDVERHTTDESVKIAVNYIQSKINKVFVN